MNQELWSKIMAFDLDKPPSEYGFSTRLANENFWTKAFTERAILEYKKFMYLAATSDFMVSPSEIIDTVWHQHLIFTQSYQEFCNLLGKQIQHVPSTRNREDALKFQQAKERTIRSYERDFGVPPVSIWGYKSMFDSLNLEKSKFKIRSFLVFGILAFICLTVPFYFLLKPIYLKIDNPYFMINLSILILLVLIVLEFYNRKKLKQIVSQFDKSSFIYELQPFELIYMKTRNILNLINGTVNELIKNGTIKINDDETVKLSKSVSVNNIEQLQVASILNEIGTTFYAKLARKLSSKFIFFAYCK